MRGKCSCNGAGRAGRDRPAGDRRIGGGDDHADARRADAGRGDVTAVRQAIAATFVAIPPNGNPARRRRHRARAVPARRADLRRALDRRRDAGRSARPARRFPATRRRADHRAGSRRHGARREHAADPVHGPGRRQLPVVRLPLPVGGVPRLIVSRASTTPSSPSSTPRRGRRPAATISGLENDFALGRRRAAGDDQVDRAVTSMSPAEAAGNARTAEPPRRCAPGRR